MIIRRFHAFLTFTNSVDIVEGVLRHGVGGKELSSLVNLDVYKHTLSCLLCEMSQKLICSTASATLQKSLVSSNTPIQFCLLQTQLRWFDGLVLNLPIRMP